jgi:hypothetical protein
VLEYSESNMRRHFLVAKEGQGEFQHRTGISQLVPQIFKKYERFEYNFKENNPKS